MRLHLLALALGLVAVLAAPAVTSYAANDQLVVTQDESSMEAVIGAYFRDAHKLIINDKMGDNNDAYLEIPYEAKAWPAFRVLIDTDWLSKDKTSGKITSRGVLVHLHSAVTVPDAKRAAVLEVLNDYNRKKVFCSAYINTDGEIRLDWVLNVQAAGLPTEYVFDTLTRLVDLWTELYPTVADALK